MVKLQLAIPEPCHQNWNEMTPNEQGRYCNSCAKTVVDFSGMTDTQLLNYFLQLKGKDVCGKIDPEQLQRTISSLPAPRKKMFRYWQYMAAFFIMLFKAPHAKAQTGMVSVLRVKTELPLQRILDQKITLANMVKQVTVMDADDQPIAGASIKFRYGGNTLFTDSNGAVSFKKENETETLVISAVGYKKQQVMIKDILFGKVRMEQDIQSLETVTVKADISLLRRESRSLGAVAYGVTIHVTKEDSISKLINYINPSITAYPNPVASGNAVNLSLKIKKAGTYRFYIYDASGKLMLAQNHTLPEKTFVQSINIPSAWSHGIYFVVVVDEDGKNVGKVKIVVQ